MDFTYTHTSTEKSFKEAVYFYLYTVHDNPWLLTIDIFAILLPPMIFILGRINDAVFLLGVSLFLLGLKPLLRYYYWISLRNVMRRASVFDTPQEIRITNDFFEIKRGENIAKGPHVQGVTDYLLKDDMIVFLSGRVYAGGLNLAALRQAGLLEEYLTILKGAGIKEKHYAPWTRPVSATLSIIAAIVWIVILIKLLIM